MGANYHDNSYLFHFFSCIAGFKNYINFFLFSLFSNDDLSGNFDNEEDRIVEELNNLFIDGFVKKRTKKRNIFIKSYFLIQSIKNLFLLRYFSINLFLFLIFYFTSQRQLIR